MCKAPFPRSQCGCGDEGCRAATQVHYARPRGVQRAHDLQPAVGSPHLHHANVTKVTQMGSRSSVQIQLVNRLFIHIIVFSYSCVQLPNSIGLSLCIF